MLISSTWIQTSNSNGWLGSPPVAPCSNFRKPVFYLLAKSSRKAVHVKARVVDGSQNHPPSKRRNPLASILEAPQVIWRQTLQPLSNFGFGQRSIWEGGVGLFVVSGVALVALNLVWLRGFHLRSQFRKYEAVFEFSQACGLCVGTPVRIRGVTVGKVVHVNSSLKSIEAVVEVLSLSTRGILVVPLRISSFTLEKQIPLMMDVEHLRLYFFDEALNFIKPYCLDLSWIFHH